MAEKSNKSHFTQKQSEKDERPSKAEIKLRKLDEIVLKLKNVVDHKEKYERTHKELSKQKVNNKSNYSSPTTSRMKEDTSDREFLNNFMNIDEHTILPKNMHLLTDNDTNQSISPQEKFKNLSNLMLDDKNITELNFIRSSEERVKLNLYTAFSKKSRDLFMNDNHPKRAKNQILFHKINDIHIPKFEFKPTISPNFDKNAINSNESSEQNMEKSCGSESFNNNLNSNDKNSNANNINNIGDDKYKNEEKKFTESYFRQEKKGYFHIPTLVKIEAKPPMKKEFRKQKTYIGGPSKMFNSFKKENKKTNDIFWDPEIDADTLSYINHNFISIEDIYNSKNIDEKDKNKNNAIPNDENEPNLIPIQAKEIVYDNERQKTLNNFVYEKDKDKNIKSSIPEHVDIDKLKYEVKNDNKFIEFIAINPGVIRSEYQVVPHAKEELKYELNLKKDFRERINNISEIDIDYFPKNGSYNAKKIERVLRFQQLVQEIKEIDLSLGVKQTTDESDNTIKESNENEEKNQESNKNVKNRKKNKKKTYSEIDEKQSLNEDNEDSEEVSKNIISINTQNSGNQGDKSELKKVFNFNEGNSERSPFSSEKSNN